MRYMLGFVLVCAFGAALVGCEGSQWSPGQCEAFFVDDDGNAAYRDVADGTACIYFGGAPGVCVAGGCERRCARDADCTDHKDCTANLCDMATGLCSYVAVSDGDPCAGGTCQDGGCALTTSHLPCVEQGVRNAIAAGAGPYTFDCDGPTAVMTEAEIVIDKDVILDGENKLILDGSGSHRVLFVAIVSAELRRLTVIGGNAQGVEFERRQGGGIYNTGYLKLTGCTVSGSTAEQYGGGIYNRWRGVSPDNSRVDLYDSMVSGNRAEFGGGIHSAADLAIVESTVVGNVATRNGGGIYSTHHGSVIDSTVSGNTASGHGGGIYGGLDLLSSTVSGNAAELGAGIYNTLSSTAVSCTVSGNTASARGGGIFNDIYGEPTLVQISIWDNAAPEGRSIFSDGKPGPGENKSHPPPTGGGTLTVKGSLIQGDCHIEAPAEHVSLGSNIEGSSDTCGLNQPSDQVNVAEERLNLGPLANNGGPTMTHALGAGSVAIDVIPEAECVDADRKPLTTDQRGVARPQGDSCDVGAFELEVGP